jgi:hypothetical protein
MPRFCSIFALFAIFIVNGVRADASYTVPRADQQPKHVTYMYCRQETAKINNEAYTHTVCHATNGQNYEQ